MLNQKKIKVIKRHIPTVNQNLEVQTKGVSKERGARDLTRRVNDWVSDWRERKSEREFRNTALFFASNS